MLWKKISSRVAHQNPWFKVHKDRVVRPDGRLGYYHVVETRGPAVFVLARDSKGRFLFVEMFRYPTQRWSVEIPAGNSEGQPPLAAAKRELREETGYAARRWKKLGKIQSCNGISSESSYIFLAEDLVRLEDRLDESEGICRLFFWSLAEIRRRVRRGGITDAQTMAALLLLEGAV